LGGHAVSPERLALPLDSGGHFVGSLGLDLPERVFQNRPADFTQHPFQASFEAIH